MHMVTRRHPIGDYLAAIHQKKFTRAVIRLLGIIDLHSQFRLRPLLRFFAHDHVAPISILELGCGNGVNLFEIYRLRQIKAIGYDLNNRAIEEAQLISRLCFNSAIDFRCEDVFAVEESTTYDYLLCIDILEHVERPRELLANMDRYLKVGGCLVISVPTEHYPRIFGRRFHEDIGHVMGGYSANLLNTTVPENYRRISVAYSTGLIASVGCMLYYRVALRTPIHFLRTGACISLMTLFKWLDIINSPRVSCSLFAVYQKEA